MQMCVGAAHCSTWQNADDDGGDSAHVVMMMMVVMDLRAMVKVCCCVPTYSPQLGYHHLTNKVLSYPQTALLIYNYDNSNVWNATAMLPKLYNTIIG